MSATTVEIQSKQGLSEAMISWIQPTIFPVNPENKQFNDTWKMSSTQYWHSKEYKHTLKKQSEHSILLNVYISEVIFSKLFCEMSEKTWDIFSVMDSSEWAGTISDWYVMSVKTL